MPRLGDAASNAGIDIVMSALSKRPQDMLAVTKREDGIDYGLSGDWIGVNARRLERELKRVRPSRPPANVRFDLAALESLDTIGAWLVVKEQEALAASGAKLEIVNGSSRHLELLKRAAAVSRKEEPRPRNRVPALLRPFDALGRAVVEAAYDVLRVHAVLGQVLASFGLIFVGKGRGRLSAYVNQFDQIIFRAVPIVVLISIVVGAIITQQTILQLRNFGVAIYVVDLSAVLMLREVGLLLAAIMIAGRSGSAITAEIGSMRMREELDALSVMGVDPYRALVLPRMLALVLGLPLLAFIGAVAGLAGTAIVAFYYGDIPYEIFIERLRAALTFQSLSVGLIKAPAMALIIGLVAINEGFKVKGSSESLGRRTTASVVRAIFLVIVADGVFAMFFAAIGW